MQSPSLHDFDQRQMFCLSLFPGKSQSRKVFRKEVVFLVDISGSMQGDLLENAKNALLASFSNLSPEDSFNIIAFNGEIRLFSSSMELASKGAIQNATQWLNDNLIADGGTQILLPLKQVRLIQSRCSGAIVTWFIRIILWSSCHHLYALIRLMFLWLSLVTACILRTIEGVFIPYHDTHMELPGYSMSLLMGINVTWPNLHRTLFNTCLTSIIFLLLND